MRQFSAYKYGMNIGQFYNERAMTCHIQLDQMETKNVTKRGIFNKRCVSNLLIHRANRI